LNRLYEQPCKRHVRAVLDQAQALDGTELVAAFARWWIKTILLLQHPKTASAFPGAVSSNAWELPPSTYTNLLNGLLPSDVSLWLALSDDENGCDQLVGRLRLYLPTTFRSDGRGGRPATVLNGYRLADTRALLIQFLRHPLCDFEHPFERAGLAVRVWPHPPERLDIASLPLLSREGRDQLGALFVDSSFGEHLPDVGWRTHIEAVAEGCPLRLPLPVAPSP